MISLDARNFETNNHCKEVQNRLVFDRTISHRGQLQERVKSGSLHFFRDKYWADPQGYAFRSTFEATDMRIVIAGSIRKSRSAISKITPTTSGINATCRADSVGANLDKNRRW